MPVQRDYTGKKYSHLTFTSRAPSRIDPKGVSRMWWYTICDCGNIREVEPRQVTAGRVHSCGKCKLGRDLAARGRQLFGRRRSLEKKAYTQAIGEAARLGLLFTITPNVFIELVHRTCVYCAHDGRGEPLRVAEVCKGVGYTEHNLVPLCAQCAAMRGRLNHQDFLDKCREIAITYDQQVNDALSEAMSKLGM